VEGSILLLVFGFLCILLAIPIWFRLVYETLFSPKPKKEKTKPVSPFTFNRLNEVEGVLLVDGKKINTYNVGKLHLDDKVTLCFYEGYGTQEVRITDIYVYEKSLYSFAPNGNWREKAEYALSVLKQLVNDQTLPSSLVIEIEDIILNVDLLNEHIKQGRIVSTDDEKYAWV
jgi:hypothetical protein